MSQKKISPSKTRQKTNRPTKKASSNRVWIAGGIGLLIVIIATAAILLGQNKATTTSGVASLPAEISVDEAANKRVQGAFILDVRQPEEWQEYHIPGSTLIPLSDLPNRLNEIPKDRQIVVVCRSGNRSREGRDILLANQFPSVTSMSGGLKEWASKGYETVTGP